MTKSSAVDLVTQTDQKVEKLIIQSVKEKFPQHRYEAPPPSMLNQLHGPSWVGTFASSLENLFWVMLLL